MAKGSRYAGEAGRMLRNAEELESQASTVPGPQRVQMLNEARRLRAQSASLHNIETGGSGSTGGGEAPKPSTGGTYQPPAVTPQNNSAWSQFLNPPRTNVIGPGYAGAYTGTGTRALYWLLGVAVGGVALYAISKAVSNRKPEPQEIEDE